MVAPEASQGRIERELERIYANRFTEADRARKARVWRTICEAFLDRYVPPGGTVLDIGAGYCEFVNHVHAGRRIAVDLNPDTARAAAEGVEVLPIPLERLGEAIEPGSVDLVFASNVFEHLRGVDALLGILDAIRDSLRPEGKATGDAAEREVAGGTVLGLRRSHAAADGAGNVGGSGAFGVRGFGASGAVSAVHVQVSPAGVALAGAALFEDAAGTMGSLGNRCSSWRGGCRERVGGCSRRGLSSCPSTTKGRTSPARWGRSPHRFPSRSGFWWFTTLTKTTRLPVVRALKDEYPWVELVRNNRGRGVLNAIRSGILAARAEVVVITMADLSDDLTVVSRMVSLIRDEGFDVVCASRYMRGGRQLGGPPLKGFLSRAAGVSLYWLGGLPVHDATNAFRAYRRSVLAAIPIESTGGFEYSLELTAKAHAMGKRITEVPSTWRDRTAGESRFRLRAWLPKYLRWYLYALTHRPRRRITADLGGMGLLAILTRPEGSGHAERVVASWDPGSRSSLPGRR